VLDLRAGRVGEIAEVADARTDQVVPRAGSPSTKTRIASCSCAWGEVPISYGSLLWPEVYGQTSHGLHRASETLAAQQDAS
jgi:hypothetical protein